MMRWRQKAGSVFSCVPVFTTGYPVNLVQASSAKDENHHTRSPMESYQVAWMPRHECTFSTIWYAHA